MVIGMRTIKELRIRVFTDRGYLKARVDEYRYGTTGQLLSGRGYTTPLRKLGVNNE